MTTGFGRRAILSAVAAGATLLGMDAAAGTEVRSASAKPAVDAHIRVLHASPDAPAVDVHVNGTKAISDLAFGKASD